MAESLQVGEEVFVSFASMKLPVDAPSAFYHTHVAAVDRSKPEITVAAPNGEFRTVHPKFAFRSVQFLVIAIGDYYSEHSLLRPLHDSVTSFLRILIPGDQLKAYFIRTLEEFAHIWEDHGALTSHVILIGHGADDALLFGKAVRVRAEQFESILASRGEKKIFMSLCCHTGSDSVGAPFSKLGACQCFIAPSDSVHGCTASQFCQTFFSYVLLEAHSPFSAWREACVSTPLKPSFVFWTRGNKHVEK